MSVTEDLWYQSCSCLPPYSIYDIPFIIWPLPGEKHLPSSTYLLGDTEETGGCQGLRNLLNTGKKSLYSSTWNFCWQRGSWYYPDVFAVYTCNLLFNLNMWILWNSNLTFICEPWRYGGDWRMPGTKKTTKYREEIFILIYLKLLLTKRIMIILDVHLFMPVHHF